MRDQTHEEPATEAEPEIAVVFRKSRIRAPAGLAAQVTAVFPCLPFDVNGETMTCYAHVGQHSGCSLEWFKETRVARPTEYRELLAELRGAPFHYRLRIYSRIHRWMHLARRDDAKKIREGKT